MGIVVNAFIANQIALWGYRVGKGKINILKLEVSVCIRPCFCSYDAAYDIVPVIRTTPSPLDLEKKWYCELHHYPGRKLPSLSQYTILHTCFKLLGRIQPSTGSWRLRLRQKWQTVSHIRQRSQFNHLLRICVWWYGFVNRYVEYGKQRLHHFCHCKYGKLYLGLFG